MRSHRTTRHDRSTCEVLSPSSLNYGSSTRVLCGAWVPRLADHHAGWALPNTGHPCFLRGYRYLSASHSGCVMADPCKADLLDYRASFLSPQTNDHLSICASPGNSSLCLPKSKRRMTPGLFIEDIPFADRGRCGVFGQIRGNWLGSVSESYGKLLRAPQVVVFLYTLIRVILRHPERASV